MKHKRIPNWVIKIFLGIAALGAFAEIINLVCHASKVVQGFVSVFAIFPLLVTFMVLNGFIPDLWDPNKEK
jgi:hypothetical protein